jgi:hypothetical protein
LTLAAPPAPGGLPQLRDDARAVLKETCGRCHDSARPTAKPAALKIFDLHEQEWSARMSDVQMGHMANRFEGFGMPVPDRARVQAFIDAELARRAELTDPPPVL